jgi:molecular chaperone DnaK
LELTLTRATFEALTEDLRQRMVGPTLQALSDANLTPEDIDGVILVGGATRMPAVQDLIQTLIGRVPYKHIHPDEVVALGAAIQAGILTGEVREVVLVDVTPLSLGIETQGGIFTKIIPRNTPIPTSQSLIVTTAGDNQTAVDIHVLQGEREMAAYNMSLGTFRLSDIEPQPRGEPRIEVTFDIDASGLVHVSAVDLQTGNKQSIEITSVRGLSPEEMERMVQEARIHAEEDQRQRHEVETSIRANSMIAAAQYMIERVGEKADASLVNDVEKAILEVKLALAEGHSEKMQSKTEALKTSIEELDRAVHWLQQREVR